MNFHRKIKSILKIRINIIQIDFNFIFNLSRSLERNIYLNYYYYKKKHQSYLI